MAAAAQKYPPQIKYIIGNEGCERYSYYGMRSILTIFMVQYLLFTKVHATEVMHLFMGACYLLPLLGSFIADRLWGRYKTILYLSLLYCVGHGILAAFETEMGLYFGLGFIALGAGAIKPCVSAFVGDQFSMEQKDLVNKVYNLFYFIINFGSTFSTILTPWTLKAFGPSVAFGIPGVLMAIATFIFWLGRDKYVKAPPSGADKDNFWAVLRTGVIANAKIPALVVLVVLAAVIFPKNFLELSAINMFVEGFVWVVYTLVGTTVLMALYNLATGNFMKSIRDKHPAARVEEFLIAMNIMKIFAGISVFWAMFDQHASTWVLQAEAMERNFSLPILGDFVIESSQVSAINPILVMLLIPIMVKFVYPTISKFYELTPLRKMAWGMVVSAAGFAVCAFVQMPMDSGTPVHVSWQFWQYLIMTTAEVMISITGLEFAYTQAPKSLKSTIMSFWLLTVFFGNMITVYIVKASTAAGLELGSMKFYLIFAVLMLLTAGGFALIVKNYKMRYVLQN